jgi:hypothetical protein
MFSIRIHLTMILNYFRINAGFVNQTARCSMHEMVINDG